MEKNVYLYFLSTRAFYSALVDGLPFFIEVKVKRLIKFFYTQFVVFFVLIITHCNYFNTDTR